MKMLTETVAAVSTTMTTSTNLNTKLNAIKSESTKILGSTTTKATATSTPNKITTIAKKMTSQQLGGSPLAQQKPPKVLLKSINEEITCNLCKGYLIDATTIVECLHSFCHSCLTKHLRTEHYCPRCEMMINKAKPNIKPDATLQAIVYKLVPGLYEKELLRKRAFYRLRPVDAMLATPEQRGEDTEHLIFGPTEQISLSLEYADVEELEDHENFELKTLKYLQCPAIFTVSLLKKFVIKKYSINTTEFFVEIMYKVKTIVLPDHYKLMDVAYIYTWKRDAPMRFFFRVRTILLQPEELPEIQLRRSLSVNARETSTDITIIDESNTNAQILKDIQREQEQSKIKSSVTCLTQVVNLNNNNEKKNIEEIQVNNIKETNNKSNDEPIQVKFTEPTINTLINVTQESFVKPLNNDIIISRIKPETITSITTVNITGSGKAASLPPPQLKATTTATTKIIPNAATTSSSSSSTTTLNKEIKTETKPCAENLKQVPSCSTVIKIDNNSKQSDKDKKAEIRKYEKSLKIKKDKISDKKQQVIKLKIDLSKKMIVKNNKNETLKKSNIIDSLQIKPNLKENKISDCAKKIIKNDSILMGPPQTVKPISLKNQTLSSSLLKHSPPEKKIKCEPPKSPKSYLMKEELVTPKDDLIEYDDKKYEFLNSFQLTAKKSLSPVKSPVSPTNNLTKSLPVIVEPKIEPEPKQKLVPKITLSKRKSKESLTKGLTKKSRLSPDSNKNVVCEYKIKEEKPKIETTSSLTFNLSPYPIGNTTTPKLTTTVTSSCVKAPEPNITVNKTVYNVPPSLKTIAKDLLNNNKIFKPPLLKETKMKDKKSKIIVNSVQRPNQPDTPRPPMIKTKITTTTATGIAAPSTVKIDVGQQFQKIPTSSGLCGRNLIPLLPKANSNEISNGVLGHDEMTKLLKNSCTEIKKIENNGSNNIKVYGPTMDTFVKTCKRMSPPPPPPPISKHLNYALMNVCKNNLINGRDMHPPPIPLPRFPIFGVKPPNSPIYSPNSPQYNPNYNIPTQPQFKYMKSPSYVASYMQNLSGNSSQLPSPLSTSSSSIMPPPLPLPALKKTVTTTSSSSKAIKVTSPTKIDDTKKEVILGKRKCLSPTKIDVCPPEKQKKVQSLLNSCNINLPSSLSITLTNEQNDPAINPLYQKNSTVNNYIEILKLNDTSENKVDENKINNQALSIKVEQIKTEIQSPPKISDQITIKQEPIGKEEVETKNINIAAEKLDMKLDKLKPIPNLNPVQKTVSGGSGSGVGSKTRDLDKNPTFQEKFLQSIIEKELMMKRAEETKRIQKDHDKRMSLNKQNNNINNKESTTNDVNTPKSSTHHQYPGMKKLRVICPKPDIKKPNKKTDGGCALDLSSPVGQSKFIAQSAVSASPLEQKSLRKSPENIQPPQSHQHQQPINFNNIDKSVLAIAASQQNPYLLSSFGPNYPMQLGFNLPFWLEQFSRIQNKDKALEHYLSTINLNNINNNNKKET